MPGRDGELIVALGKSRSGKTAWVRSRVHKAPRVLVWDVKGEWASFPEFTPARSVAALQAALLDGDRFTATPARIAFVPPVVTRELFGLWARSAHAWCLAGHFAGLASPGVVVAEELPDVTAVGKATAAWGTLLRQGLGAGVTIYALSTSPAESDKTTLNNATLMHVGPLGTDRTRRYAASLLDVSVGYVEQLAPLEYLERHNDGRILRGRIGFNAAGVAYIKGRPRRIPPARSAGGL